MSHEENQPKIKVDTQDPHFGLKKSFMDEQYAELAARNRARVEAFDEMLAVCKKVASSLGITKSFGPIGTLEFAADLLAAIEKAEAVQRGP